MKIFLGALLPPIVALILAIVILWHVLGYHIPDQLYGCPYSQSDPATGECK